MDSEVAILDSVVYRLPAAGYGPGAWLADQTRLTGPEQHHNKGRVLEWHDPFWGEAGRCCYCKLMGQAPTSAFGHRVAYVPHYGFGSYGEARHLRLAVLFLGRSLI